MEYYFHHRIIQNPKLFHPHIQQDYFRCNYYQSIKIKYCILDINHINIWYNLKGMRIDNHNNHQKEFN
ncbi:unnamed protein product [Paramecium sonneborni]|uniref:Uncharacterized protein n=1 Tax=Paramecium sonneborni TaxID=65129 RepID=A0A8S1NCD8_9CILI|nr:unnamed protein product [Paramecium sonneborni]